MLRHIRDNYATGVKPSNLRSWVYANTVGINTYGYSDNTAGRMLQQAAADGLVTAHSGGGRVWYTLTKAGEASASTAKESKSPVSPPRTKRQKLRSIDGLTFSLDRQGRIHNDRTGLLVNSNHERGMASLRACLNDGFVTVQQYESFKGKKLNTQNNGHNVGEQLRRFSLSLGCEKSVFKKDGDKFYLKNQPPKSESVDRASGDTGLDNDSESISREHSNSETESEPHINSGTDTEQQFRGSSASDRKFPHPSTTPSSSAWLEPTFTLPVFSSRDPGSVSWSSTHLSSIPQRGDEAPPIRSSSTSASQPGGPALTYHELHDYSLKRDKIKINGGPVVTLVEVSHPDSPPRIVQLQTCGDKPDAALLRHFYPSGTVPKGVVKNSGNDTWTYNFPWTDKVSFQVARQS